MKKISIKHMLPVIVPTLVAIVVVSGLAISGSITKEKDKTAPTAVVSTTAPSQSVPKVPEDTKVSIVAVGDNLIHNTLISSGKKDDGTYDYSCFYENVKPYIESADLAVINQETMLGGSQFEYQGYPCFNTPWEVGEAAIDAGFDLFTCATNHSLDVQKFAGIEQECKFFDNHPEVAHIGTNDTEEEYNSVSYLEKNGIKFAVLNYTDGTNGIPLPEDKPWCVNMLDKEKVKADIKLARESADVVMVFPHWGTENSHDINDEQKEYVKLFSDLGVDIVIGTHPHVLQPVEWVENEKTHKKMLVYYSIGNFISHQINLNQLCGGMAEITVERVAGEIKISSAKLTPVVDFYESTGSGYRFSVYRLSDFTEDVESKHSRDGATASYFTELAQSIVSEEFLNLE